MKKRKVDRPKGSKSKWTTLGNILEGKGSLNEIHELLNQLEGK